MIKFSIRGENLEVTDALHSYVEDKGAKIEKYFNENQELIAKVNLKVYREKTAKVEVTIPVKIGEGGKLFGSVTSKDIADALLSQHKVELDKRKIDVKDALKAVGTYPVSIKLHPEISAKIQVHIIPKQ